MTEEFLLHCKCGEETCETTLTFGDANATLYFRNRGVTYYFDLGESGAKSLAGHLLDWLGYSQLRDELEHGALAEVKRIVAVEQRL